MVLRCSCPAPFRGFYMTHDQYLDADGYPPNGRPPQCRQERAHVRFAGWSARHAGVTVTVTVRCVRPRCLLQCTTEERRSIRAVTVEQVWRQTQVTTPLNIRATALGPLQITQDSRNVKYIQISHTLVLIHDN